MTYIFSSPLLPRDYSNDGNCLNVGRTQLAGMNSENGTISQRKIALGMKLTHGSPLYGHEGKTWLITRCVQEVFLGFPVEPSVKPNTCLTCDPPKNIQQGPRMPSDVRQNVGQGPPWGFTFLSPKVYTSFSAPIPTWLLVLQHQVSTGQAAPPILAGYISYIPIFSH